MKTRLLYTLLLLSIFCRAQFERPLKLNDGGQLPNATLQSKLQTKGLVVLDSNNVFNGFIPLDSLGGNENIQKTLELGNETTKDLKFISPSFLEHFLTITPDGLIEYTPEAMESGMPLGMTGVKGSVRYLYGIDNNGINLSSLKSNLSEGAFLRVDESGAYYNGYGAQARKGIRYLTDFRDDYEDRTLPDWGSVKELVDDEISSISPNTLDETLTEGNASLTGKVGLGTSAVESNVDYLKLGDGPTSDGKNFLSISKVYSVGGPGAGVNGINIELNATATANSANRIGRGIKSQVFINPNGFTLSNTGGGGEGIEGATIIYGTNGGTVRSAVGGYWRNRIETGSNVKVNYSYTGFFNAPMAQGTLPFDNVLGVYVHDQNYFISAHPTNVAQLFIGQGNAEPSWTGKWSIYSLSNLPSYINNRLYIGTTSPVGTEQLRVNGTGYFDGAVSVGTATLGAHALQLSQANTYFQPLDGDLTSIAGLSETSGILRKTTLNTWALGGISGSDLNLAASSRIPYWNGSAWTTGLVMSSSVVNSSVVQRTSTGQGAFNPAINGNEAVVLDQMNSAISDYAKLSLENTFTQKQNFGERITVDDIIEVEQSPAYTYGYTLSNEASIQATNSGFALGITSGVNERKSLQFMFQNLTPNVANNVIVPAIGSGTGGNVTMVVTATLNTLVETYLKSLPSYNASTPQLLGHDASGNLQWVAP